MKLLKVVVYTLNITLLVLLSSQLVAQNNVFNTLFVSDQTKADQLFDELSYRNALALYLRILAGKPQNRDVQYKAAHCYLKLNQPDSFIYYLEPLMRYQSLIQPIDKYHLGEAYATTGNPEKALNYYQAYALEVPGDSRIEKKISSMENRDQFYQDSAKYQIAALPVNSENSDFAPAFYQDGIVFVSSRRHDILVKNIITWNNEPLYNIFYYANGSLKKFSDFEAFLLKGPLTFYDDEQKVMFTGSSMKTKEKIGRLQLFTADKENNGWSEITTFPYNELDYSFAYPAISQSGDTLIFASDMPGGMGGMDLYISYRYNDAWSKPENLGSTINTEGDEVFPFISKNNFLYYSSNGLEGLGGLDIYQVDLENKSEVKNMGAPINSIRDDFGFIINGNEGYFSSNRTQENSDELYSFVYHSENENIKPVEITISNLVTKDEVPYTIKDDIVSFWGENKEKYKIEASLKGFDIELLRTAEKDDTIRFKIPVAPKPPSMQLVAVVKDETSKEIISGANVSITSLGLPVQNLITDSQGKVTFNVEKNDVFLITAMKGNQSGIHNDVALMSMLDEEIEIFLTEQEVVNSRITAFVVDESTGERLTDFKAGVTEMPTGKDVPLEINGSLLGYQANARHQYEIAISKEGYENKSHKVYFDPEVNPLKEKIKIGLVPQPTEFTLKGHIYDGITGAPLVNANIEVTSLLGQDQQVKSDQYGNFFFKSQQGDVIIIVGSQGEKLGMYNDEVTESSLGKVIQIAAYSEKEKEFVNGVIVDANTQKPLEGCQVFIVDQKTGQKMPYEQKGAAVNFTANKGTHYKVTARLSGYDDNTIALSFLPGEDPLPTSFKIEMHENKPLVAMQGYVFDGITNEPVAGASVEIISLGFQDQLVESDANGFFKFKMRLNDAFLATAIKGEKAGLYTASADEGKIYNTVQIAINAKDDQFLVAGFVIDEKSGELIDQAEVTIVESSTDQKSYTNSNQGIFSFHALPGNQYQISAEYPGYEKNTITVPFDRLVNQELNNISIALKPANANVSVRGYVYDINSGEAVSNATVEVVSMLLPDQEKQTNASGHVDFDIKVEQEFIVMVTHEQKAGMHTGMVTEEDIHKLIRIGISGPDETQKIAGLVMDQETNTPIDDAEVYIINQTTGDSLQVTQKGGFIEFEAKPGETYNIIAKKSGYKEKIINLPYNPAQIPAPQDMKINLERHRPEITLQGLAYDGKTGKALEHVNISVTSIVLPDQDLTSDKNGKFTFKAKVEEPFVAIGILENMGGFYAGKITLDQEEEVIKVALYTREDERIIAGFILDKETRQPVNNVRVKVIENSTGQIVPAEINNGLVSFKGYPGSDYTIKAEKTGYRQGEQIIPISQLKNNDPENFNLFLEPYQPEILVNAHLYDGKTGKGLPEALINVTGLSMSDTNMVTDENGNFQFKAKVADIIMVMGSNETKAGYYAGMVEAEWANDVLEIAAHGEGEKHSINGYITDSESGKPLQDVAIRVVDLRTGEEVALDYNNGVLSFDGLEGHDYKIIAVKAGYKNTVDFVSLANGKPDKEPHLKLERYLPELIVKAQVYDGLNGKPVPDTNIEITSLAMDDQNAQSDEFGYFSFNIKAEAPFVIAAFYGKKTGLYNGQITAADAQKIIRIPLYGPREAQLLAGIVIDEETGDPVEDVNIEIIEKSNLQPVAIDQKDGAFNFNALPGNVYQLRFSKSGYKEQTIILPYNPQVDPKPDLKVVFQRRRPVVTIRGHIYAGLTGSPLPNATIEVTSITQDDQIVVSDEFGNFNFKARISDAFVLMSNYKDLAGYINESVEDDEEFEVIQLPMYKRSDRYDIAGFVADKNTKKPIIAPEVSIVEQSTGRIVDYEYNEGLLTFSLLPDNTYKVNINKFGYKESKIILPYYPASSQIPAGFTSYMEPVIEEVMVKGIAMNGSTRQPLPDAKISVTSLQMPDQELLSDANGIFNFKVAVGDAFVIMGTHQKLSGIYSSEMDKENSASLVRLMMFGADEAVNVAALVVDKETQNP
ncbi:MAG: carboxypeptidase regulatory-like domain-containing protein, partial [Cyclobacteriaceae bacterium]